MVVFGWENHQTQWWIFQPAACLMTPEGKPSKQTLVPQIGGSTK
jgi:hypothetical protein